MATEAIALPAQQEVLNLLFEQDDVGWKAILLDLVKTEQMDPWDINITLLTQRYLQAIRELQEHDLKVSGKVLLAAALLLRIKSTHFLDKDLAEFDQLLYQRGNDGEELMEELTETQKELRDKSKYKLIPRNPQPRSRKVSIHDLINALQRAMEIKKKILAQQRPVKYILPKRNMDIVEVIYDLYHKIMYYSNKNEKRELTFSQLLPPKAGKQEKAYTFIPLLHLENLQKIETEQKKHFDEIYIKLLKSKIAQ
ncbi:segregation/condensation protein A [Candidatus Woesearchaeota archaeon]|nr:segregation/condensation protein A [Candidatus Woesearchaeota archaeon]